MSKGPASRICVGLCIVLVCAGAVQPARAGYWEYCYRWNGTQTGHSDAYYDGTGWGDCPIDWERPWTGACSWVSDNALAFASRCVTQAYLTTQGQQTRTLDWVPNGPNDPPPPVVWLHVETVAEWYARGHTYAKGGGHATNSIGTSYKVDRRIAQELVGKSTGDRWKRVDSSSGHIEASCDFFAAGCVVQDNPPQISSIQVDCVINANVQTWPPTQCPFKNHPPWDTSRPRYPGNQCFAPRHGAATGGGDPVDLSNGQHEYSPAPDITVYNPHGPEVAFQRAYSGSSPDSSPGWAIGWADNYYARFTVPFDGGPWGGLLLQYPNGASESLWPLTDDWVPPEEIFQPVGAPYVATGVSGRFYGQWQSLKLTWKDGTQWVFTPSSGDHHTFLLSRIVDSTGHYVSLLRNGSGAVAAVTDDSTPANILLTLNYSGGRLASVIDAYGRKVTYTFGQTAGSTCLLSTSQLVASQVANPPARETYEYETVGSWPRMTGIIAPSPTGSGTSRESIVYDPATERVVSLIDAGNNVHSFDYEYLNATSVQARNSIGQVEDQWTQNFSMDTCCSASGSSDAAGQCVALEYGDWANPTRPSLVWDKKGRKTSIAYDAYGNITQVTSPLGITTTYGYNYDSFPLGRLTQIREGSKTPITMSYHEPSGLVHTITRPKPGATDGSTVTTSFTYDALGNVLTIVGPGNGTAGTITTTFNYTSDGGYSQPTKLRQPLTVTDNLGHVTHYRYNERGNVTSTTDALGNETNFTYNIADQLLRVIQPPTSP